MSDVARSPLFTWRRWQAVHPHNVRCGAESAIYTVPWALPRISTMSDEARSPLFTQLRWLYHASLLCQMGHGVRYLHSFVGVAMPYDVIYGARSPLFTRPRWLYHASL